MLSIEKTAIDDIVADAMSKFPEECCGFLFGTEWEANRVVTKCMAVANALPHSRQTRYTISAGDYRQAECLAEQNNLALLGIYHSHPNHPALPSESDRASAFPHFSYLIVSVYDRVCRELTSWRLNERRQFEQELIANSYLQTI